MAQSQKRPAGRKQRETEDRAKLSPQDLLQIRLSDEPAREICKRFGVDYRTINYVRYARLWPNRD